MPVHVAKTLTFPEVVNASNIERLKRAVANGDSHHPGANHVVERKTGNKRFLRYADIGAIEVKGTCCMCVAQ